MARNFVDHEHPPVNAAYAALAEFIAPRDISRETMKAANARLRIYSDQHGDFALQEAITKGIDDAKKNLVKVPIFKGTIPHEQIAKFSASKVWIKPASHGTGVIAGGAMRAVLESAGVTDVLAKSLGSTNPHNVVKATILALSMVRDPLVISQTRNVNLKKVFNG